MTKKILITGMNAAQCKRDYFLGQELKITSSQYAVIRCLEDMGFEVEQRAVSLGEDLSHYDEVIVYMHSIQAFCQRMWGGLYAIAARPNAILAFDDWQVDQIFSSFINYLDDLRDNESKAFRQYLFDLYQGKEDAKTVKSYKNSYIEACETVLRRNNRLLICAYNGGDLSLLNLGWNQSRIFAFNPNPYLNNRRPDNNFGEPTNIMTFVANSVKPEDKLCEWNFASLVQNKTRKWLKSQNFESWKWPIRYYGQRRGENKQERLTESEMCRVFMNMWGCVMPGYFHSGSGWWRVRVLQVADAGSILLCDSKEGAIFGEAYVGLRAQDIELMDVTQLNNLAKSQKECLYDNHPLNKEITRNKLMTVMEAQR